MANMKGEVSVAAPPAELSSNPVISSSSTGVMANSRSESLERGSSSRSSGTDCSKATAIPLVKKTPKDFIFGKVLGEGSFSTVYLAKDVNSEREFAIKVCDKRHILREKKQAYVKREKEVLNILNNDPAPFFVKLYCTFQDPDRLYFVLTYAKCGELLPYINKVGSFDEDCTRFYAAEIVLALEHIHGLGIIHRDLKPENILLSEQMHILITDFGSAKILSQSDNPESSSGPARKNSFVGTAQYVSPELLTNKCVSKSCDLWALGCIVYQMISGLPPFRAPTEYLIFQKIIKLDYEFPEGFNKVAQDLVQKLLVVESTHRLGMSDRDGSYESLKAHSFFKSIDWEQLPTQTPPPIYPYLPSTPGNEELRSQYRVPCDLKPGLDDSHMTRLLGLGLHEEATPTTATTTSGGGDSNTAPSTTYSRETNGPVRKTSIRKTSVASWSPEVLQELLSIQARDNQWHRFVQNNLILKQGIVDKRKGLFAKRRMLLLTTGPHLYYVDPVNMVLKGEIPWSTELWSEPKNFKTFFVHTPNRTYYLEDPEGYALEWCRVIDEVRKQVPTTSGGSVRPKAS